MKRVFESSRGTLFRWISADDWLEPGCLSTCARALESRPDAIGVTTAFTIHTGRRVDAIRAVSGRVPHLAGSGSAVRAHAVVLPCRRCEVRPDLRRLPPPARSCASHPLRPSERTDWLLSAELALRGPILNVPERLANRTRDYPVGVDRAAFRSRLDPVRAEQLQTAPRRLYRELYALAVSADLTERSSAAAGGRSGASASRRSCAVGAQGSPTRGIERSATDGGRACVRALGACSDSSTRRTHASRQKG